MTERQAPQLLPLSDEQLTDVVGGGELPPNDLFPPGMPVPPPVPRFPRFDVSDL